MRSDRLVMLWMCAVALTTAVRALPHPLSRISARCLDLRAASMSQLEALPAVGPSLARRIAAFRDQNPGRIARVDDLDAVPGVGPATLARIRPLVCAPSELGVTDP